MEQPIINYETLIRITKAISTIRDPEEIVLITVEGVTHSLGVRACALFLFSAGTDELKIAGSYGLSKEYLNKGPISPFNRLRHPLKTANPSAFSTSRTTHGFNTLKPRKKKAFPRFYRFQSSLEKH
jgi:hypothetical protein